MFSARPLPPLGSLVPLQANFTLPKQMSGLVAAAGVMKEFTAHKGPNLLICWWIERWPLFYSVYSFYLISLSLTRWCFFTMTHLLLSDKEENLN